MAQETGNTETTTPEQPAPDNLVAIKDTTREKQVLEINNQMSSLEASISKLSKQLSSTNKQIKTDVERLTTSDAEITDKVADTYKQLGVIENTFQDLNTQSSKISKDLKAVNSSIRKLEKETRANLESALDNQNSINDDLHAVNEEFRKIHDSLIEKSESLSKKSTALTRKLNKSIKDNSQALSELEARIVTELETLARSSEARDDELSDQISAQKAKMLLMQSVDEALDKRVGALEKTSHQLLEDSDELKDATQVLGVLTTKLSDDIEALELFTRQLEEQNKAQQAQIDGLEEHTDSLGRTLLALATLEKKHFRILGAGSLVLLLALIAAFFYGEYQRDTEFAVESQRNEVVNNQIANLNNRVADEQMASQVFYNEITGLEKTIEQLKGELKTANEALQERVDSVNDTLQSKLIDMTDQVDSIDGRVQYLAPLYNFGSSNTIHGTQWISALNPEHLSIKVATVENKQDLYEIAQRYNNHFPQELAYFMTNDGLYTLIYGGKFTDETELSSLMRRMPAYMNGQRLEVISNADVLQQIAK